ncbi:MULTISPECIES: arylamine N-acetyltransferase family protein [unclassified Streptomyces]|uniref:arylamine N-acetyltransferase family protein n=1 Tax=unclassified Streptomyces TaxID=2593676 RepID=UPI0018EE6F71|nr:MULTISPECIES: arylamine N-acetyltransferase [unclassified Streptomyces]MBJ6616657.1 arylamine N-acetyltransferase [Streptomyces sp. I3(2020)]MBJ6630122.1 arylamine N-acetyltransferase [Streptomyces sp. I4(2020)]
MDAMRIDYYLRRMGTEQPAWPTVDALRELHLRHLRTVPFENLSIHLGEEIVLDEKRLLDKIVAGRRGGFCYELNGAFGALLAALGYDVTLLAARVYGGGGRLGIPYDHLALRVRTVDGDDWLADVGFGAHCHLPLAFGERGEQEDPGGTFRIVEAGADAAGVRGGHDTVEAADLDVMRDGRPVYRLEVRPRALGDFVAGAWWHSSSPLSHFTRSLVCSRITGDGGRITLSGRRFTVTAPDGTREEREITADEEVLALYRDRFGIVSLDTVPTVRQNGATGRTGENG